MAKKRIPIAKLWYAYTETYAPVMRIFPALWVSFGSKKARDVWVSKKPRQRAIGIKSRDDTLERAKREDRIVKFSDEEDFYLDKWEQGSG